MLDNVNQNQNIVHAGQHDVSEHDHFCRSGEEFIDHGSRPTPLLHGNKQLGCYNEIVSQVIVYRKLKENVTYIHAEEKKKYFTTCILRMHRQEREREMREMERQTDGWKERVFY